MRLSTGGRLDTADSGIDGLRPGKRPAIDQLLATAGLDYFLVDAHQLRQSPPDYGRHSPCRVYWVDGKSRKFPRRSWCLPVTLRLPLACGNMTAGILAIRRTWSFIRNKVRAGCGTGGLLTDVPTSPTSNRICRSGRLHRRIRTQPTLPRCYANDYAAIGSKRGNGGLWLSAFDTELFGHWWFEGPQWVSELIRQLTANGEVILTTCGEYLQQHVPQHQVQLAESSWGDGGDHRVWWQAATRGVWRDLYEAECAMQRLGESLHGKPLDTRLARIVQQAGRELLLLQSSDWPFMISTRSTPDHARQRAAFHSANFQQCCSMAERYRTGATIAEEDWTQLAGMEQQDVLFRKLDLRPFGEVSHQLSTVSSRPGRAKGHRLSSSPFLLKTDSRTDNYSHVFPPQRVAGPRRGD